MEPSTTSFPEPEKRYFGLAISIVELLNVLAPDIADLILLIRRKDGTISVAQLLDEADAGFAANLQQATDWLKTHPSS